jgi:hypothetical protein
MPLISYNDAPPLDPQSGFVGGLHLPRSSLGLERTLPNTHVQIAHVDSSRHKSLDVDGSQGPMTVESTGRSPHTQAGNPTLNSLIDLDSVVTPPKWRRGQGQGSLQKELSASQARAEGC